MWRDVLGHVGDFFYSVAILAFVLAQPIIIFRELYQQDVRYAVKRVFSNISGIIKLGARSGEPLNQHINAAIQEATAERIRIAAAFLSHFMLIVLIRIITAMKQWEIPRVTDFHGLRGIWVVLISPVAQVWTARPLWVGPRSSYVIWLAHCVSDCGCSFLFTTIEQMVSEKSGLAPRFVIAVVLGKAPIAAVVNLLISFCSIFAYTVLVCQTNSDGAWQHAPAFSDFVFDEIITCACVIACAWFTDHRTWKDAKVRVEASVSAQAELKTDQVLCAMSDAVLRLDGQMRIMNESPQLAELLYRGGDSSKLEGCNFIDLVDENDRDRVIDCLSAAEAHSNIDSSANGEAEGKDHQDLEAVTQVAPTVHLGLRDGLNGTVQVQMFFVPFPNKIFEYCYLLVIREFLDFKRMPQASELDLGVQTVIDQNNCCTDSDPPSALSLDGELSLRFSAATFQIVRASCGFSKLFGPSSIEVPFLYWLADDQRSHFKLLVQTIVNAVYNDEVLGPVRGTIQFQPPGMISRLLYDAAFTLEMDEEALLKSDDEDEVWIMRMFIHDVKIRPDGCSSSQTSKPGYVHEELVDAPEGGDTDEADVVARIMLNAEAKSKSRITQDAKVEIRKKLNDLDDALQKHVQHAESEQLERNHAEPLRL